MAQSKRVRDSSQMTELHERLNKMRVDNKFTDFTIKCGAKEFRVHRLLMIAASPYFEAMLTHELVEKATNQLELNMDPDLLENIIKFIYTGVIGFTDTNVEQIMLKASMFQMDKLEQICEKQIMSTMTYTNCVAMMEFADRFNMKGLAPKALSFLQQNFSRVVKEPDFLQMNLKCIKRLLLIDDLNVSDESQVLDALLAWVEFDESRRLTHLTELLPLIRLVHLAPHRLIELAEDPLIVRSEECLKLIDIAKNYRILSNDPVRQESLANQLNLLRRGSSSKAMAERALTMYNRERDANRARRRELGAVDDGFGGAQEIREGNPEALNDGWGYA